MNCRLARILKTTAPLGYTQSASLPPTLLYTNPRRYFLTSSRPSKGSAEGDLANTRGAQWTYVTRDNEDTETKNLSPHVEASVHGVSPEAGGEDKKAFSKLIADLRACGDGTAVDEGRAAESGHVESIDDFQPYVLKKLLGLTDETGDYVLENVSAKQLKLRMSMPFEAALRHFNGTEPNASVVLDAFFHAREELKEMWKPFPGDYKRVLSLIPHNRTSLRYHLYLAMLEDYRGAAGNSALACRHKRPTLPAKLFEEKCGTRNVEKYVVPGGGCPREQDLLISIFEKKHRAFLERIAFKDQVSATLGLDSESPTAVSKRQRFADVSKDMPPLDPSSPISLFHHMRMESSRKRFAEAAAHCRAIFELLAAEPCPWKRRELHGSVTSISALSRSFVSLHLRVLPLDKVVEAVKRTPAIQLAAAAGVVAGTDMEMGLELFAFARSRGHDTLQLTPPKDFGVWVRAYLKSYRSMHSFVSSLVRKAAQSYKPVSPREAENRTNTQQLLALQYLCCIYMDTSFRASTDTYNTARGRVLLRARATDVINWSTSLPSPVAAERFDRLFLSDWASALRGLEHPFQGTVFDGSIDKLSKAFVRNRIGIIVMDSNQVDGLLKNPREFQRSVMEHVRNEMRRLNKPADSGPRSFRILLPWSVLFELNDGTGRSLSRGRMLIAFKRLNGAFSLTPAVDAAAAAMSPYSHLYGRGSLAVPDRHVANIALTFDSHVRASLAFGDTTRSPSAAISASIAGVRGADLVEGLADTEEQMNIDVGIGDVQESLTTSAADEVSKVSSKLGTSSVSTPSHLLFYYMHIRKCLEAEGTRIIDKSPSSPFRPASARLYDGFPTGFVVVATRDVELSAYCQEVGLLAYPPRSSDGDASSAEHSEHEEEDKNVGDEEDEGDI